MKRVLALVALATLASVPSLSYASGAVPTAKPMLGTEPYPGTVGFGQIKPSRLGGRYDVVCDVHWDSWGGQIALGTGIGWAVNPNTYKRTPSAVVVYLYHLKIVQGAPAYTTLNFAPVPTQHLKPLKAC